MTCHLAIAERDFGVLFSDSQLSTAASEYHGGHKQYIGDRFLIAGAGLEPVFQRLFQHVSTTDPATIAATIESFVRDELTPEARREVQILLLEYQDSGDVVAQEYYPALFNRFGEHRGMHCVGTGAEFVWPAWQRDSEVGVLRHPESLVDTIICCENYLDAAESSLTVDEILVVGILANGKSYVMGDRRVNPVFVPLAVAENWDAVSDWYETLIAIAATTRGEIREAQRLLSEIQIGQLASTAGDSFAAAASSVQSNRELLAEKLTAYFQWYDDLTGRS